MAGALMKLDAQGIKVCKSIKETVEVIDTGETRNFIFVPWISAGTGTPGASGNTCWPTGPPSFEMGKIVKIIKTF